MMFNMQRKCLAKLVLYDNKIQQMMTKRELPELDKEHMPTLLI